VLDDALQHRTGVGDAVDQAGELGQLGRRDARHPGKLPHHAE
jgi:hypothetical protein